MAKRGQLWQEKIKSIGNYSSSVSCRQEMGKQEDKRVGLPLCAASLLDQMEKRNVSTTHSQVWRWYLDLLSLITLKQIQRTRNVCCLCTHQNQVGGASAHHVGMNPIYLLSNSAKLEQKWEKEGPDVNLLLTQESIPHKTIKVHIQTGHGLSQRKLNSVIIWKEIQIISKNMETNTEASTDIWFPNWHQCTE